MVSESIASPERHLAWQDCLNARDLGGYPAQDGSHTRWRALVRSDTTSFLTPVGQQAVLAYGIQTVIDLRFPAELEMDPSPFDGIAARSDASHPDYLNLPLDVDHDLVWKDKTSPVELMSDMYRRLLESNRGHVAASLGAIARARPGGVLIHCHAGKDRTGLITAMVLSAIGVTREAIAVDYALSGPYLDPRRQRDLLDPALSPVGYSYRSVLYSALPETILLTLDYLDRQYGSVTGYLETTQLRPGDIPLLRQRLLEPDGSHGA
jgi:protein tyrosine/serine phosphatase